MAGNCGHSRWPTNQGGGGCFIGKGRRLSSKQAWRFSPAPRGYVHLHRRLRWFSGGLAFWRRPALTCRTPDHITPQFKQGPSQSNRAAAIGMRPLLPACLYWAGFIHNRNRRQSSGACSPGYRPHIGRKVGEIQSAMRGVVLTGVSPSPAALAELRTGRPSSSLEVGSFKGWGSSEQ